MGQYINKMPNGKFLSANDKAEQLLKIEGAKEINEGDVTFQDNLVCIVQNGAFDAAAFMYSQSEFDCWVRPDSRLRRWLIIPNAQDLVD